MPVSASPLWKLSTSPMPSKPLVPDVPGAGAGTGPSPKAVPVVCQVP